MVILILFGCQRPGLQQGIFQRPMIFMLLPPLGAQESQCCSRPFIIGPFQCAAQQPLPEFPVPFPHGRVHAVPFQIQFQKAAEDSSFLRCIKHIRPPFTNRGYCNTDRGK